MPATDEDDPTDDRSSGQAQPVETEVRETAASFDRAAGWAVIILAVLAVLAALAIARVFVVPVLLAFLLALVFSPLCRWLQRRGVPPPVSALAVVTALLSAVVATTITLTLPVSGWIEDAPALAREAEWKLRGISGVADAVTEAGKQIEDAAQGGGGEGGPVEVVIADRGPLATAALDAPVIAAQTVFVLILMYFVLASGSLFYERLVSVMPSFEEKRRSVEIVRDIEREVSRYLFAVTMINAGLGLAVGTVLGLLGMPNPVAFGLMAFVLNFVPFIGALIGVGIAFAIALVSMPSAFEAFAVAGAYFALTSIEGQVVTPWLVGRHLRLNTVVILIAVAFWAWLWSIMGMIMAVPLLVTFRVLCRHIPALGPVEEFLAGRDD